jgi:hypothetical protein
VLATNGKGIVEGIARFFLMLALGAFVVLLVPIITAIMGVTKNNQNLKGFSKIYALITLGMSSLSLLYNHFELLGLHLIFIFASALPLIILGLSGKQNDA